jgi:hypothetical protein
MKTLNEYIDESLLDDEEVVMARGHKSAVTNRIKQLHNRQFDGDPYVDTYGRKLEIGDIVIFHYAASMEIGIISKFDREGDLAFINAGDRDLRSFMCMELMKIPNDKVFLELIK